MEHKRFISKFYEGEYLDYLYSSPDTDKKLPLVFYIHGAGCRGSDITMLDSNSALLTIEKEVADKCVIAAPQCHCNTWFELFDVLLEFIDMMRTEDNVDTDRVYICGASMGGYTTWQVAMSRPEWFAAIAPVCGGGMYWNAGRLKNVPVWAFHGARDMTVLPEESLHMVKAVVNNGGNARITIYPEAQHNSWDLAFSEKELWKWMFSQKRVCE